MTRQSFILNGKVSIMPNLQLKSTLVLYSLDLGN